MDPLKFQLTLVNGFMERLEAQCTIHTGETRLAMAVIKRAIIDLAVDEDFWEKRHKKTRAANSKERENQRSRRRKIRKDASNFLLGADGALRFWTESAGLSPLWVKEKITSLIDVLAPEKKNKTTKHKVA